jgi:thiol-disulfide isomerase/thioredoxin
MKPSVIIMTVVLICAVLFMIKSYIPNTGYSQATEILMYGNKRCGYCKKMLDEIEKNKSMDRFKYIEVSEGAGKLEFDNLNKDSVPYFLNPNNNKNHTGYMPYAELMKRLT